LDDAERIPIDIGYEEASPAAPSDPLTTIREDGTLVIDIRERQPCVAEPTTEQEIVVCAQAEGDQPGRLPQASLYKSGPPPLEKLHEALTEQVGPLFLSPFGMKLKF